MCNFGLKMWGASQCWEGVTILPTIIKVKGTHCLEINCVEAWSLVSVCVYIYIFSKFTSLAMVFGVEYIMRLESTIGASVTWKYPMDYPWVNVTSDDAKAWKGTFEMCNKFLCTCFSLTKTNLHLCLCVLYHYYHICVATFQS